MSPNSTKPAAVAAFCFCCAAPVAFGQAKTTPDKVSEAVKEMENQYRTAAMRNDGAFFEEHLSPIYVGTDIEGKVVDAATVISERKTNHLTYTVYDVSNQAIRVSGDTAVVSECVHVSGLKNGSPRNVAYQILRVWQNAGGKWRVLAFAGVTSAGCPR
jgi:ketosteroid isomerase-like protein